MKFSLHVFLFFIALSNIELNAQFLDRIYMTAGINSSETINRGDFTDLNYNDGLAHRVVFDDARSRLVNNNVGIGYTISKYLSISVERGRHDIARKIFGTIEFPGGADTFTGDAVTLYYYDDFIRNDYTGLYSHIIIPQPYGYTSLTFGYEMHNFSYVDSRIINFDSFFKVRSFYLELAYYHKIFDLADVGLSIFFKDFYKTKKVLYLVQSAPFTQSFVPKSLGMELSVKVRPFKLL